MDRAKYIKLLGAAAAVAAFFIVRVLPLGDIETPVKGLLAILASAVILWITTPIPIYFTALLIPIAAWLTHTADFQLAFSGFSGTTFWFLFAAFGIAGCVRESGVARRIALLILSSGKPSFKRLMLLLVAAMFVLGYILPLAAARSALMLTIAIPLIALFGVHNRSNIGKSIVITVTILGAASGWQVLTGGMPGMILWGALGQSGYYVSWIGWALVMVVPTALVFAGMYLVITRLFRPESQEIVGGLDRIEQEKREMGPVKPVEKRTLVYVAVILLAWLTEPFHNIGVEAVGIMGVLLFLIPGTGTIDFEDFIKKAVPWSLLLFVGALMSLIAMAASTGLGDYIGRVLVEPVYSFASNPPTFILATWLLNTVACATMLFVPSLALFVPAIVAAAAAAGVNPVVGALVYLSCFPQVFFWAAVPFFPLAYSSGAVEARDWAKVGFFFWLLWPLVHIICLYTWYPFLQAVGILS